MHIRIVQPTRDTFAFQLILDDGEVGLTSGSFADRESAARAVDGLLAGLRQGSSSLAAEGDEYRVSIVGDDGEVIASSAPLPSLAEVDARLAEMRRWGVDASPVRIEGEEGDERDEGEPAPVAVVNADTGDYDLRQRSSSGRSGVELVERASDGQQTAHVNDSEGRALVVLRGFATRYPRDKQVRSLVRAAADVRRIERREDGGGAFFVVKARNGAEIARSRWFEGSAEREAAIAWLMNWAVETTESGGRAPAESTATGSERVEATTGRKRSRRGGYDLCRRSSSDEVGVERFRVDSGEHYFHVNDAAGEALLFSHGYKTARSRDRGVEALARVAVDPERFRPSEDGRHFVILAGNGREIVRSRGFPGPEAADSARAWVRGFFSGEADAGDVAESATSDEVAAVAVVTETGGADGVAEAPEVKEGRQAPGVEDVDAAADADGGASGDEAADVEEASVADDVDEVESEAAADVEVAVEVEGAAGAAVAESVEASEQSEGAAEREVAEELETSGDSVVDAESTGAAEVEAEEDAEVEGAGAEAADETAVAVENSEAQEVAGVEEIGGATAATAEADAPDRARRRGVEPEPRQSPSADYLALFWRGAPARRAATAEDEVEGEEVAQGRPEGGGRGGVAEPAESGALEPTPASEAAVEVTQAAPSRVGDDLIDETGLNSEVSDVAAEGSVEASGGRDTVGDLHQGEVVAGDVDEAAGAGAGATASAAQAPEVDVSADSGAAQDVAVAEPSVRPSEREPASGSATTRPDAEARAIAVPVSAEERTSGERSEHGDIAAPATPEPAAPEAPSHESAGEATQGDRSEDTAVTSSQARDDIRRRLAEAVARQRKARLEAEAKAQAKAREREQADAGEATEVRADASPPEAATSAVAPTSGAEAGARASERRSAAATPEVSAQIAGFANTEGVEVRERAATAPLQHPATTVSPTPAPSVRTPTDDVPRRRRSLRDTRPFIPPTRAEPRSDESAEARTKSSPSPPPPPPAASRTPPPPPPPRAAELPPVRRSRDTRPILPSTMSPVERKLPDIEIDRGPFARQRRRSRRPAATQRAAAKTAEQTRIASKPGRRRRRLELPEMPPRRNRDTRPIIVKSEGPEELTPLPPVDPEARGRQRAVVDRSSAVRAKAAEPLPARRELPGVTRGGAAAGLVRTEPPASGEAEAKAAEPAPAQRSSTVSPRSRAMTLPQRRKDPLVPVVPLGQAEADGDGREAASPSAHGSDTRTTRPLDAAPNEAPRRRDGAENWPTRPYKSVGRQAAARAEAERDAAAARNERPTQPYEAGEAPEERREEPPSEERAEAGTDAQQAAFDSAATAAWTTVGRHPEGEERSARRSRGRAPERESAGGRREAVASSGVLIDMPESGPAGATSEAQAEPAKPRSVTPAPTREPTRAPAAPASARPKVASPVAAGQPPVAATGTGATRSSGLPRPLLGAGIVLLSLLVLVVVTWEPASRSPALATRRAAADAPAASSDAEVDEAAAAPAKAEDVDASAEPTQVADDEPPPPSAAAGEPVRHAAEAVDRAPIDLAACTDSLGDLGIATIPAAPAAGRPLRIVAATLAVEVPLELELLSLDGRPASPAVEIVAAPGVPSAAVATWSSPTAGSYRVAVRSGDAPPLCRDLEIAPEAAEPEAPREGILWTSERVWSEGEEALYSAWIRELFRGDALAGRSVAGLDQLTSDPARNLLHDALGLGEDRPPDAGGLELRPDGADLAYFLRAYWSWKRRLPFAFRVCSRGTASAPPRCKEPRSNLSAAYGEAGRGDELARIQRFFAKTIALGVHSGNALTAHGDSASDLYPIRIDRESLRPGIVYADPFGHAFVLSELRRAGEGEAAALLGVHGQPDGALALKPFSEGTFLWGSDAPQVGAGFKHFRPALAYGDGVVQIADDELGALAGRDDLWRGYTDLEPEAFYDAVREVFDPPPWDPQPQLRRAVDALAEIVRARVDAVERGAAATAGRRRPVGMPRGARLFEGAGSWQSLSTPARDLRLLMAIDVVLGVAPRIRERPDRFALRGDVDTAVAALERDLDALLREPAYSVTYARSDGSEWTLTLADIVERSVALERAYNPNDCPEIRWGAPAESEEAATCDRRAPAEQRARMERYRDWFHERRLPARGSKAP